MTRRGQDRAWAQTNHRSLSTTLLSTATSTSLVALLLSLLMLSACGGNGSSSTSSQSAQPLSGNWQFNIVPSDGSFTGGIQGGFLLQKKGSVTGQVVYSLSPVPQTVPPTLCGGSAPVTGTVSGQNVTLTVVAGGQTFALTGTLSGDGSTMTGTYNLTGQ